MNVAVDFFEIYSITCGGAAGGLEYCTNDLKGVIPAIEGFIAAIKAKDIKKVEDWALEILALGYKVYKNCLVNPNVDDGVSMTNLKEGPTREEIEKMGAEFATGFLSGTQVDHFDKINLFECLHREPTAVDIFIKASLEL